MLKLWAVAVLAMLALSVVPVAASAQNEMTWQMKSTTGHKVEVAFFSQDRKGFRWPGNGRAFTVTDDEELLKFRIGCLGGEKICYGAWVAGRHSTFWGMGPEGTSSCQDCCFTCNGNLTKVITFNFY
jgi:hypothetical protein